MKNKLIPAFLAGIFAVSLLTCPASARTFPDVPRYSSYAAAVDHISDLGIMVGDDRGNFGPDRIVSRAEMAVIVCRMMEQAEGLSASNVFTDVPTTHWANPYIGRASELNIISGYGNGRFGPSDPVTYEQAVTMVVRAVIGEDLAGASGGYPNGYMIVAEAAGLLEGIRAGQGQGLSRGSVAVLLYNCYTFEDDPGSSGDSHVHDWATRHIDEMGHYESGGTRSVEFRQCECGYEWNDGDSDELTWLMHYVYCDSDRYWYWYEDVQGESRYVIDVPAHDETYCTICGMIQ